MMQHGGGCGKCPDEWHGAMVSGVWRSMDWQGGKVYAGVWECTWAAAVHGTDLRASVLCSLLDHGAEHICL